MNCEKHGCPLTPLFTSSYCKLCDADKQADGRELGKLRRHAVCGKEECGGYARDVYQHEETGVMTHGQPYACDTFGQPTDGKKPAAVPVGHPWSDSSGWYHNYPVCGTDANGSDVDDMDVCMGMVVGGRHLHKVGLRQEALDALRNAQDTPQPDVCMGLSVKLEAIRLWQQRGLIDEHCARDLARSALQGHSLSAYERDMAEAMAASLA